MQGSQKQNAVFGTDYARDRHQKPQLRYRLRTRARVIADALRRYGDSHSGLDVMDMGSAEGRTLAETCSLLPGNSFIGVEYSRELVESAVDLPDGARLIEGDITSLPQEFAPQSFDVVSALAVLENLHSPQDAVREAARVLKPGGLFIATFPEPNWCHVSYKFGLRKEVCDITDVDKRLITRAIHEAGLQLVEFRRFMFAPISYLTYLHVPVSPGFSLACDRWIAALRILNWLFVNQAVVGRKPSLSDRVGSESDSATKPDRRGRNES